MNKSYFRIYLYNLIISYYKKGAYNNGNYNNIYLDKYKRLLSQHIRDEPIQHTLSTLNVENCKGVNNQCRAFCKLNDKSMYNKTLNKKTNEKNIIDYYISDDKVHKEYVKYHKKNIPLKRNKKSMRIKDVLYKMIFKRRKFWKFLKYFLTTLGLSSLISFIVMFIPAVGSFGTVLALILLGIVLSIIILCVIVWLLVTWLWPYKDEYNRKHKK
ncbi:Plasmodium exported protein, unknown function [Plasmodium reichenowi]|uniref:Exported protein (Hyp15) n=1 Tax=Plasmodium reichenowi TaxID=5854 RepID=A0A060RTN7_PLARE|nr:Plasmodium exported protein, unknown function [Plasmodium reichenowi]